MSVSKQPEPVDIRSSIQRRLSELGHSTYWLQKQLHDAGVHVTVYRYLTGERDVSSKIAGQMLGVLGLKVTAGRVVKKRRAIKPTAVHQAAPAPASDP